MRLRPKLSYANVMVTLLAFVVLCGGGAYAAGEIGRNTVGPKQLRANSVTSAKVKNGSLKPVDFAKGALRAGGQGPSGPAGPPGSSSLGPAYQASGSVNYDVFSSSPYGSTVVTLAVPPGPYFATSSITTQTVNATPSTVQCRLESSGSGLGGTIAGTQGVRGDQRTDSFTLAGLFNVTGGGSLALRCSKDDPVSGARILDANIVAVRVESITGN